MAPGCASDLEHGDWGRQTGRGAAAGHGVEGVQEGTDTLLAPEVSSPRGDCFFLCPT